MKALLSSGVLLAVLAVPTVAEDLEDPTPATRPASAIQAGPSPAEIAALITRLADPAHADDAKQKLIAAGELARPQVEKLADRKLADEILSAIDTHRVTHGTRVSMKVTDTSLEEVLRQLSRFAGVPIRLNSRAVFGNRGNNAPPERYTLEYNDVPFWTVLRDICEKAAVGPYNDGQNRRGLTLAPANFGGNLLLNSPSYSSGPALCLMTNLSRRTQIQFGPGQQPNYTFNATMTVMVEPKIRIGSWNAIPTLEEAVDDKGNNLLPKDKSQPSRQSTSAVYRQTQNQAGYTITLDYPADNPGTRIARLRGKATMNVITRSEEIEIGDLGKQQTRTASNGARIVVRSVKPQSQNENNRQWTVQVSYYRDGSDMQRFADMVQGPCLRLVDAAGNDLRYQPSTRTDANENEASQTLTFFRYNRIEGNGNDTDVTEPAKLIWEVPIDSQELSIPFEFTDLPMP